MHRAGVDIDAVGLARADLAYQRHAVNFLVALAAALKVGVSDDVASATALAAITHWATDPDAAVGESTKAEAREALGMPPTIKASTTSHAGGRPPGPGTADGQCLGRGVVGRSTGPSLIKASVSGKGAAR
jgi:hypothetical protein